MNDLVENLIKIFNAGVTGFVILSLAAAGVLFVAWCMLWSTLSCIFN